MHALEVDLAPEMLGEFSLAAGGKAGFPFRVGQGRVDLAVVVGLVLAGTREKVGQLAQQHIQLHGAALNGEVARLLTGSQKLADLPSRRRVTTGSAFEITTGAERRSPLSSRTPSPGRISATATPAATTAPASRAASQK